MLVVFFLELLLRHSYLNTPRLFKLAEFTSIYTGSLISVFLYNYKIWNKFSSLKLLFLLNIVSLLLYFRPLRCYLEIREIGSSSRYWLYIYIILTSTFNFESLSLFLLIHCLTDFELTISLVQIWPVNNFHEEFQLYLCSFHSNEWS